MNFDDIYRMHAKHGLTIRSKPTFLTTSEQRFREEFLREELLEFEIACKDHKLGDAADALVDLVVVAMGTAVMMGLPWHALWKDVLRANMAKVRGASARAQGETQDLIKPDGWLSPQSSEIIEEFSDYVPPPPLDLGNVKIITLCGSTRFKEQYEYWNRFYTLKGYVVLSVGAFGHSESVELSATTKAHLDQLHLQKIMMSSEVFVINVGGYIGKSTTAEIRFCESRGIKVSYLESIEC